MAACRVSMRSVFGCGSGLSTSSRTGLRVATIGAVVTSQDVRALEDAFRAILTDPKVIADAKRGDGRATLTLKDGSEVPVSRTYAGVLREKGWI